LSIDAIPKMVYVEDQVNTLRTRGILAGDEQIYVEITKKDGTYTSGDLVRINEKDLVMSRGFHTPAENDSISTMASPISIAKDDILILKVY
jgi:hypothetical protein